jgi:hypothetical protein
VRTLNELYFWRLLFASLAGFFASAIIWGDDATHSWAHWLYCVLTIYYVALTVGATIEIALQRHAIHTAGH